jgi:hypothetical protein
MSLKYAIKYTLENYKLLCIDFNLVVACEKPIIQWSVCRKPSVVEHLATNNVTILLARYLEDKFRSTKKLQDKDRVREEKLTTNLTTVLILMHFQEKFDVLQCQSVKWHVSIMRNKGPTHQTEQWP